MKEVVIGSSATMLLRILSICLSKQWKPGDEIIVTNSDHEANVSCWTDLQEKGIIVKTWQVNPETFELEIEELNKLLTDKTKLVTVPHVSNILGTINPVKEIGNVVHENNSLFCIDGVAFAPHRLIDVKEFGADFYVYSCYKVYGPHLGLLHGKYELLREMDSINHYFIGKDEVPYKFQPGNFNYELTYSLLGVLEYLKKLHDYHFPENADISDREKYIKSFRLIEKQEEIISNILLDYLKTKEDIRIIGNPGGEKEKRVPTISFVHKNFRSSDVVVKIDKHRIGIRYGDFYTKKLINDINLEACDGVIRASMVHYNTVEEVKALIKALEDVWG